MSNNQTNFDPVQAEKDLEFIVEFQNQNGAPLVFASLPKITTEIEDSALLNPYLPVNEKNIEIYKNEFRLSIKLKRFMAYGVVASVVSFILMMITQSIDFIGGLTNTLWTISAGTTILLYLLYRFKFLSKFEEFSSENGKEVSFENSKLANKIKKQNETAGTYIESREHIECNLANFEGELKNYMKDFEKRNELVTLSWNQLGAKKVLEEMKGSQD